VGAALVDARDEIAEALQLDLAPEQRHSPRRG
jgi:hypothetical protein